MTDPEEYPATEALVAGVIVAALIIGASVLALAALVWVLS